MPITVTYRVTYIEFSQSIYLTLNEGKEIVPSSVEKQSSRIKSRDIRYVDSDFNLVTNQPQMVEAARIAYRDYPTAVNEIPESGKTYENEIHQYAKMDSSMQRQQKAIGGSSDSSQLAQSYMWSKVAAGEFDEEYTQLYHNTVILATLAQVAIDSIKKEFAVNPNDEIERIRNMPCMKRKKDFPLFMKYTHKIPATKNGIERPYDEIKNERKKVEQRIDHSIVCPMNYMQSCLDKIQGAVRDETIETEKFFVKIKGTANDRQMSKIRSLVEEYDSFVNRCLMLSSDSYESYEMINIKAQEVLEKLRGMKISAATMNRLIETSLGIIGKVRTDRQYSDATKYTSRMLSLLYKMNKERFLSNFINKRNMANTKTL